MAAGSVTSDAIRFARTEAQTLLTETELFDELGVGRLAARARCVARDLLDALDALEASRNYTRAVSAERDRWRDDRWREAHGEAWPK